MEVDNEGIISKIENIMREIDRLKQELAHIKMVLKIQGRFSV